MGGVSSADVRSLRALSVSAMQNDGNSGSQCVLCARIGQKKLLLSLSGILEDDMVNLHPQGSLSSIGARNFTRQVVYAKEKTPEDQPSAKNNWIVFVRPSRAVRCISIIIILWFL